MEKTMIYLIILICISASLFAYEEVQEWLGTKWGDIREHIASVFHRFSLILIGYAYAQIDMIIIVPFLVGIYWLMTDGLMNLMKGRRFFAVSEQSGNPFEKWNIVKFSLIIIGIFLILWS
jgi:hypothetical protein